MEGKLKIRGIKPTVSGKTKTSEAFKSKTPQEERNLSHLEKMIKEKTEESGLRSQLKEYCLHLIEAFRRSREKNNKKITEKDVENIIEIVKEIDKLKIKMKKIIKSIIQLIDKMLSDPKSPSQLLPLIHLTLKQTRPEKKIPFVLGALYMLVCKGRFSTHKDYLKTLEDTIKDDQGWFSDNSEAYVTFYYLGEEVLPFPEYREEFRKVVLKIKSLYSHVIPKCIHLLPFCTCRSAYVEELAEKERDIRKVIARQCEEKGIKLHKDIVE
jgi:hypothetical protein